MCKIVTNCGPCYYGTWLYLENVFLKRAYVYSDVFVPYRRLDFWKFSICQKFISWFIQHDMKNSSTGRKWSENVVEGISITHVSLCNLLGPWQHWLIYGIFSNVMYKLRLFTQWYLASLVLIGPQRPLWRRLCRRMLHVRFQSGCMGESCFCLRSSMYMQGWF